MVTSRTVHFECKNQHNLDKLKKNKIHVNQAMCLLDPSEMRYTVYLVTSRSGHLEYKNQQNLEQRTTM